VAPAAEPTAPVADGAWFNPYAHDVHDDPFPFYRRLRDEAPAYHNAELGFYALSRHTDVLDALHDHDTFCNRHGITLEEKNPLPMMLTMDPPDHTVMRRVVSRVFTPRRIAELEPHIRELSAKHLDAIDDPHSFDLIGDYSGRLPMDVISTMLGVPEDDQQTLRAWSDALIERDEGNPEVTPAGVEGAINLYRYFGTHIARLREAPGDDLVSGLLVTEVEGEQLTDDEVIGFCFLLVIAGNETTTKLIGNAAYWLWRFPDQRARLLADPSRLADAVEETLRYEGSTQVMARTTTRDVERHGVTIPADTKVLLLLGSANRDERFWERPDEFDIDREAKGHLAFGHGIHVCLGAALARLETRIALEHLLERLGPYDVDPGGLVRVHSGSVRGYAHMPIVSGR